MSYGMQVNCFVLSISTLFNNRLAALGVHLQNQRSIVSQRQQQQEGLKFPWRRKPAQLASDSPRSVCTTLQVCIAADDISHMYMVRPGTFHPATTVPLPPLTTACLSRRVSAASAACQEAIEQGLAAEHRLNMRLAVQCFEVNSTSVLPARSFRTLLQLFYTNQGFLVMPTTTSPLSPLSICRRWSVTAVVHIKINVHNKITKRLGFAYKHIVSLPTPICRRW